MTTTTRPNILWITTDRQRHDTLGCLGNPHVRTPNLDALAGQGLLFAQSFCQNPICSPSRASFMTGRYPRTTRLCRNGQAIPPTERLVPRLLADAGYHCGHAGKFHLAPGHPSLVTTGCERRIDDGYSVFDWSLHPPGPPHSAYTQWLRDHHIDFKRAPFEGSPYIEIGMPAATSNPGWTADRAIHFIRAQRPEAPTTPPPHIPHPASHIRPSPPTQPWFFTCNFEAPHNPFDPPEEFLRRYTDNLDAIPLPRYTPGELDNKPPFQKIDRAGAWGGGSGYFAAEKMNDRDHRLIRAAYWALCDHVDYEVGRILKALHESNQSSNTLILYHSDHGEMLGDHGIYFQGAYFYDAMMHVPLIMAWPGHTPAVHSNALVELVDIAPTLLDAAGVTPHPGMQGRTLWPILTGQADPQTHRTDLYMEYYNSIPGSYRATGGAELTGLRSRDFAISVVHNHDTGELYDLHTDPGEVHNLWDSPSHQAIKAQLLHRLTNRMAATIDPLPPTEAGF